MLDRDSGKMQIVPREGNQIGVAIKTGPPSDTLSKIRPQANDPVHMMRVDHLGMVERVEQLETKVDENPGVYSAREIAQELWAIMVDCTEVK